MHGGWGKFLLTNRRTDIQTSKKYMCMDRWFLHHRVRNSLFVSLVWKCLGTINPDALSMSTTSKGCNNFRLLPKYSKKGMYLSIFWWDKNVLHICMWMQREEFFSHKPHIEFWIHFFTHTFHLKLHPFRYKAQIDSSVILFFHSFFAKFTPSYRRVGYVRPWECKDFLLLRQQLRHLEDRGQVLPHRAARKTPETATWHRLFTYIHTSHHCNTSLPDMQWP